MVWVSRQGMTAVPEGVDVVLYGATGYTGRLVARELAASGRSFVLAGRDGAKLATLAGGLGVEAPVAQVALDDADGLERLARRGKVLVSAAGPFVTMGPPVMDAALRAGTHFLDVTGEQVFLRWAYAQHARAKDAGVTVVNAMGFDVVPSDIAALIATTAMREVESVDLGIHAGTGMSRGTRNSMAATAGKGWWYDRGRFRQGPPGRFLRTFVFPEAGEKTGVFVPWGDVVTAPRSTGAKRVRTFFIAAERTAKRIHRAWPVTQLAWKTPLVKRSLQKKAQRVGEGPSDERRAAARFSILAEATDADGVVQRGLVTGRDPYGFTAASVVHGAGLVVDHGAPHGVLTPTQAFTFGPFVQAMARFDLQWRARSLDPGRL